MTSKIPQSAQFEALVDEFEKLRPVREGFSGEKRELVEAWKKDSSVPSYEPIRQRVFEMQAVDDEYHLANHKLQILKDELAIDAVKEAEETEAKWRDEGKWIEFEGEKIGQLEAIAEYPSGSKEWLQERQNGIGGSDVAGVVGAQDDHGYLYGCGYPLYGCSGKCKDKSHSRKCLLFSKLQFITEDQKELTGYDRFKGYTGRGDAWEMKLLQIQMEKYPGEVGFCKTSFHRVDHPEMHANFDGLIVDTSSGKVVPTGVIEFKTSNDPTHWGPESDGIDGVPNNYRAQVLHYMWCAGFTKGRVVVIINEREIREYNFDTTINPKIADEMENNAQACIAFWAAVEEMRKERDYLKFKTDEEIMLLVKGAPKLSNPSNKKYSEVLKQYGLDGLTNPPEIVALDFEDTGIGVNGQILEVGCALYGSDGKPKTLPNGKTHISALYGLGEAKEEYLDEVPIASTHHITFDGADNPNRKIRGLQTFTQALESGEDDAKLFVGLVTTPGAIIMAHNASHEKAVLSQYVPGFADLLRAGTVSMLDTVDFSKCDNRADFPNHLGEKWAANNMDDFAHRWGVLAEDDNELHEAWDDARIMYESWRRQWEKLR
jgi:hypothetical protein